jgi:hypothetical protein
VAALKRIRVNKPKRRLGFAPGNGQTESGSTNMRGSDRLIIRGFVDAAFPAGCSLLGYGMGFLPNHCALVVAARSPSPYLQLGKAA